MGSLATDMGALLANIPTTDVGTSPVTVVVGLHRRVVLEINSLRCAIVFRGIECPLSRYKQLMWCILEHLDELLGVSVADLNLAPLETFIFFTFKNLKTK
jgi:hypothetical protein